MDGYAGPHARERSGPWFAAGAFSSSAHWPADRRLGYPVSRPAQRGSCVCGGRGMPSGIGGVVWSSRVR